MAYEGLEDLFYNVACLLSDLAWQLPAQRETPPRPAMLRPGYHLSHWLSYLAQIATNCIQTLYVKIKANDVHRHHPLYRMECWCPAPIQQAIIKGTSCILVVKLNFW